MLLEMGLFRKLWLGKDLWIAALAIVAILSHLVLRYLLNSSNLYYNLPLFVALSLGALPLTFILIKKIIKGEFDSDILAGISIVTSILLGEYLAASIPVTS